jgi:hypothetical protein
MELAELIGLRPVPVAGLLLSLTNRCPLHCAHCSSSSTLAGPEPAAEALLRLVESFGPADRPDVLMLTGGEPMLRADLVADLAAAARRAGTRTAVLTGAYFAAREGVPARIGRAIRSVDHFSVSLDAYHEREVPRAAVFRLLRTVLDDGVPVSVHAVGSGPDDPYLSGLVAATRLAFGNRVPMLIGTVRPVGRAAAWAAAPAPRPAPTVPPPVAPCAMAAWPVVAPDGTVLACCNQQAVDRRPAPAHLVLGHVATDDWATIRARALSSPVLRMIRAVGPIHLLARFGAPVPAGGQCRACHSLSGNDELRASIGRVAGGPVGELLDRRAAQVQRAAGPISFLRRYGCPSYAAQVAPGYQESA